MRTASCLALAALAALTAGTTPSPAHAVDVIPVRVQQTALFHAGSCAYRTTVQGSYSVDPTSGGARVRDAIIDVEGRLLCRGLAPRTVVHQIYFAATTEQALLARLAEIARIARPEQAGEPCDFSASFERRDSALVVTGVTTTCVERRRPATTAAHAAAR
jgi:hypothetical protein